MAMEEEAELLLQVAAVPAGVVAEAEEDSAVAEEVAATDGQQPMAAQGALAERRAQQHRVLAAQAEQLAAEAHSQEAMAEMEAMEAASP